MKLNDISIVVLTYNNWGLCHSLLMDIKRNASDAHQVVIIDNGSEDFNVQSGIEFWKSLKVLPITHYRIEKNIGFVGGMNRGISLATGNVIALLSNDVKILSKNFITAIDTEFERNPKILLGGELYTTDTGWNKFIDDTIIPYVGGWCMISSGEFFTAHPLDTLYGISDFEDVDLSMQAVDVGYELRKLPDGIVQHLGAKTLGYSDDRRARTVRNRELFSEKWRLPIG